MGHKIRAIQRGAKGLLQCYSKTPTKIWMTYMLIIYQVRLFIKYEINNRKIMLANIYIWIQHTHTQKARSFFRILSHKPNAVNWTENPVTKWSTTTSFLFSGPFPLCLCQGDEQKGIQILLTDVSYKIHYCRYLILLTCCCSIFTFSDIYLLVSLSRFNDKSSFQLTENTF